MNELTLTMVIPGAGAALVYLLARSVSRRNEHLAAVSGLILVASLLMVGRLWMSALPQGVSHDGAPTMLLDALSLLMVTVAQGLGLLVCLYSGRYLALDHRYEDYYPLLLLLISGVTAMLLMVDLFSLYMATVLTSAATFVLVSFRRRTNTAVEAGFKYTIMGTVASIVILAGLAYVFQSTGQLALPLNDAPDDWIGLLGVALLLAGFAVKAGLVPAHTWLPDAHGRAPSSISAMLSGIIVQTALLVMVRIGYGSGLDPYRLGWLWGGMGILSMTVGNLMALRQTFGKRLLAFSTVAQCGYMLTAIGLGVAFGSRDLVAAGVFLMVVHAAMKSCAFLSKGVLHYYCQATTLAELSGQGGAMPLVSAAFSLAVAGLAGVAPLSGFMAKIYLLRGLLGLEGAGMVWVLVAILANVLLGFWVYVPLLARPWRGALHPRRERASRWMLAPVLGLAAATVVLGVLSRPLFEASLAAATAMLSWGR